jgi:SLA1 homology domain 1, SHD1
LKSLKIESNKMKPIYAVILGILWHTVGFAQLDEEREWSDSTGKFKIVAKLVEVKDGFAYLKTSSGKTTKIPVARLSKADQQLLDSSDSPFEMIDETEVKGGTPTTATGAGVELSWSTPVIVDWDEVEQFVSQGNVDWNVKLPENGRLGFQPKRAPLAKKMHGWEGMHSLAINPMSKRAAVGYTASFTLPKPISRVSIVDLESGKAIHSEQIEANCRPLAMLGNGSSILMVGAGKMEEADSPDKLQIWKLNGKKIAKSAVWIPHPMEKTAWGKQSNAAITAAYPINENLVLTIADHGYIVLWQFAARKPVWYGRLANNFAVAPNADRSLLAILDGQSLMIVKTETAEILGSTVVESGLKIAWPRLCWSPSGKRIILTTNNDVRPLNVETGDWEQHFSVPSHGPIAPNALSCPDEDYLLLDNRLLVHLPSKIQVCEYRDASAIEVIGGTSFIGMMGDNGGLLAVATFPHPSAKKLLESAKDDPSLFLIHPGTFVSIDASGCGEFQAEVKANLEKAAKESGYVVAAGAEIQIKATVSGPKIEAISYIARGSYVVNAYSSNARMIYNDKTLWEQTGTNVPHMLMTRSGETIEQALQEAGKRPNIQFFAGLKFPEYMQKPKEGAPTTNRPSRSNALVSSRFTLQGLVDDK